MASVRYGRSLVTAGTGMAGAYYICDAFIDLPAAGLFAGDKAVVIATSKRYTTYDGINWIEDAGGR